MRVCVGMCGCKCKSCFCLLLFFFPSAYWMWCHKGNMDESLFSNFFVQAWMCTFLLVRSAVQCECMGLHKVSVWLRWRPLKGSSHSVTVLPPQPPSYMLSHWIDNTADVPVAKFTLRIINGLLWNRRGSTYMRRSCKNIQQGSKCQYNKSVRVTCQTGC